MAWKLAKSLDVLRKQVNGRWPKRSKVSDGTVGDAAHSSRPSDHNPTPKGIVCALDLTNDPKNGPDARALAEALIASKDPRIKYVISNRQIASGTGSDKPAWVWRPYSGANAHKHHVHVSVKPGAIGDDTTPWNLDAYKATEPSAPAARLDDKATIQTVQKRLIELKYNPGGADGIIGPLTKVAIMGFRSDHGLPLKEEIDAAFLAALMTAQPREMIAARANATPAQVSGMVPEARAHWWNKIGAGILGGGAAAGGAVDYIAPATGYLQPVRDFLGDVPSWVWVAGIIGIAAALYLGARYGEQKSTQAYQNGDRR